MGVWACALVLAIGPGRSSLARAHHVSVQTGLGQKALKILGHVVSVQIVKTVSPNFESYKIQILQPHKVHNLLN
jgi:hypothetical protein